MNEMRGDTQREDRYNSLISAWATLVQASNTLVNGYLLAHSFIVVASATLLVKSAKPESMTLLPKLTELTTSKSTLLASVLAVLSIAGLWLAVLMSETWARNTAKTRLLAWRLEELEATRHIKCSPTVFRDMARLGEKECLHRKCPEDYFNPNRATWRKARGGGPVRRSTYIIASVHAAFLAAAVLAFTGIVIATVSGFLALVWTVVAIGLANQKA